MHSSLDVVLKATVDAGGIGSERVNEDGSVWFFMTLLTFSLSPV